jgi:hypothetical protein
MGNDNQTSKATPVETPAQRKAWVRPEVVTLPTTATAGHDPFHPTRS